MPAKDELDKVNPGPFGSIATNFAAVTKTWINPADAAGKRRISIKESPEVDGSTMFGEGSIGKVRYAGLAYMLQQKGVIDLQQKAVDFFTKPQFQEFLERKYPNQGATLQSNITELFSGDSAAASLADLTTHRSGIGDITRDQAELIAKKGITYNFSAAELLMAPRVTELGKNGKPKIQTSPGENKDLPEAKYGEHQYSNLGYILLGLAMEAAYDATNNPDRTKPIKDYKDLTRDFMLHPIEGRAFELKKGLSFDQTKFPEDLTRDDNVALSPWIEGESIVDVTQFSGANAAGGIFTSADDSTKFFGEFFKGFAAGSEKNSNPFFSDDTIGKMMEEGRKFGNCGVNHSQDKTRNGNERFQAPGFAFELDKETQQPISFEKSGGTFGYKSMLSVNPKTGPRIDMCAQENLTGEVAKKHGLPLEEIPTNIIDPHRNEFGEFDRISMIKSEMPDIFKELEISETLQDAVATLQDNGASVAGQVSASNIQKQGQTTKTGRA